MSIITSHPAEVQDEKAREILEGLTEAGPEGTARRVTALRAVAVRARENVVARRVIEWMLFYAAREHPEEAATFRACYLDGDTRPTDRQVGRRFCMDARTVQRHNRRILEAMLPLAFGIYGLFLTDAEQKETLQGV